MRTSRPGETDRPDKTPRDQDKDIRELFFQGRGGAGDGRTHSIRRRNESGDHDGEGGWSTVKPSRKSFGAEGAERFNGRMGGVPREDRPRRNDADEEDATRRNGLTRGKPDLWNNLNKETPGTRNNNDTGDRPSQRERIDRAKSWRERDNGERSTNPRNDRNDRNDRGNDRHDRGWGGQRVERDPEWMDEPLEEKVQAHTEEDLKKFMESMKASKGGPKPDEKPSNVTEASPVGGGFFGLNDAAVKSAPAVEHGPDKFFSPFGTSSGLDAVTPGIETKTEAVGPKTAKPSRFTSFFANQQGTSVRGQTEPPTPATGPPPPDGLQAFFGQPPDQEKEKENESAAFHVLLQKLRGQTSQSTPTPPSAAPYAEPPPMQTMSHKSAVASPEPPVQQQHHQYGMSRDEPRHHSVPPPVQQQDIHAPRPMQPPNQQPQVVARTEQILQDIIVSRHNAPSQGSGRMEPQHSVSTSQRDFLMQLMQSGHAAPDPRPIEQVLTRGMQQPRKQPAMPPYMQQERELGYSREQMMPSQQRQQMRSQGPASYLHEDPFRHPENESRPQPTQILQRPPPGLDHGMQQQQWLPSGVQLPPTQRPMVPPPGLMANQPSRNVPVPSMYPPHYPPGVFPMDNMAGPPRNMQPPPGLPAFFGGGPPHPSQQFVPPHQMGGFQGGPDPMAFVSPFDGRGMPHPGAGGPFRRA